MGTHGTAGTRPATSTRPATRVRFTAAEALALRMISLLLRPAAGRQGPAGVAAVVEWFGAMQSQDLASGLWSLGARVPGSTMDDIAAALERREAIRTWPMRSTVHLVPPRDARWMLDLMGSRHLAGAARRRERIGLSEQDAEKAVEVLAAALSGGGRLTRSQCLRTLAEAGIESTGQRSYHLLWYAGQRGVTCIAPNIGTEQTYVLLDEWAPDPHRPDRDEALATIALRYFRSHGPTTRQDFAGWTGLTAADAKRGIAAAGPALASVDVEGVEMVLDPALLDAPRAPVDDLLVLPGFDEYLLGFKDRALMLDPAHRQAVIPGGNGVFQSTVVRAGRVIGIWKRTIGARAVTVNVQPLVDLGPPEQSRIETAMRPYARFVGRPLRLRWPG